MSELLDKGEERRFPEWECYVRKDGTRRWSQPLSKSWQYVKKLLELRRADLTLYSTRHLMADWLDNDAIAQRTHDRISGHASDVRGRYDRKGILDPQIAEKIEALEPSEIRQMREILLAAKNRADAGGPMATVPISQLGRSSVIIPQRTNGLVVRSKVVGSGWPTFALERIGGLKCDIRPSPLKTPERTCRSLALRAWAGLACLPHAAGARLTSA